MAAAQRVASRRMCRANASSHGRRKSCLQPRFPATPGPKMHQLKDAPAPVELKSRLTGVAGHGRARGISAAVGEERLDRVAYAVTEASVLCRGGGGGHVVTAARRLRGRPRLAELAGRGPLAEGLQCLWLHTGGLRLQRGCLLDTAPRACKAEADLPPDADTSAWRGIKTDEGPSGPLSMSPGRPVSRSCWVARILRQQAIVALYFGGLSLSTGPWLFFLVWPMSTAVRYAKRLGIPHDPCGNSRGRRAKDVPEAQLPPS